MKKIEKIDKILKGEDTGKLAASFWRHFYNFEYDIKLLADALITFQNKFKWDFIKINPRASYHIEDWDCKYDYIIDTKPVRISYPIKKGLDWKKIKPLKINESVLAEHLKLAEYVYKEYKGEVPIIFTIFLPLEIAARICWNRILFKQHLSNYQEYVEGALDSIVITFAEFANRLIEKGLNGLFIATKCATLDYLTDDEFYKWQKSYDIKFLNLIKRKDLILILHICGKRIRINEMLNYPVNILHWDSQDYTNLSLREVYDRVKDKVLMGGLSNKQMQELSIEENLAIIREIGLNNRWILGAECALEPPFNEELLLAISRYIA